MENQNLQLGRFHFPWLCWIAKMIYRIKTLLNYTFDEWAISRSYVMYPIENTCLWIPFHHYETTLRSLAWNDFIQFPLIAHCICKYIYIHIYIYVHIYTKDQSPRLKISKSNPLELIFSILGRWSPWWINHIKEGMISQLMEVDPLLASRQIIIDDL